METKQETKQETKETVKDAVGAGTLASDDIVVSVLDVDENGATIKLWPDAAAVRDKLNALGQTLYGDDYNLRRYLCGKALYCAIAIGDTTRDAPCPAGYQVNADANLNEADGSLVAAAAEWGLGFGVFNLPPRRIGKEWLQINRWRAVTARRSTLCAWRKADRGGHPLRAGRPRGRGPSAPFQ